jgi:ferredoxin--NADP+ reductase
MNWIDATVVRKHCWDKDLYSLFLRANIDPFIAGQFTYLSAKDEPKLFRPYSFVNDIDDPILEFYYTHVENGRFSTYLNKLKPGDTLSIHPKSKGRFTLENIPLSKNLWCFSTGTGLGVFISLLKGSVAWHRFDNIILVHSVRLISHLTHQKEINSFKSNYDKKFNYIPIVTQEKYIGLCERIPLLIRNGVIEQQIQKKFLPENSHAMLCGNPQMIKDLCLELQARGCKLHSHNEPGHISLEKYWK